jgi:hypothetical protein
MCKRFSSRCKVYNNLGCCWNLHTLHSLPSFHSLRLVLQPCASSLFQFLCFLVYAQDCLLGALGKTMGQYYQIQGLLCLVVILVLVCIGMPVNASDPDPVVDNPANIKSFTLHNVFRNANITTGPGGVRAALSTSNFPASMYIHLFDCFLIFYYLFFCYSFVRRILNIRSLHITDCIDLAWNVSWEW